MVATIILFYNIKLFIMGEMADYYADLAMQYEAEYEYHLEHYNDVHYSELFKKYQYRKLNWVTKDGQKILIQDMSDTHITNSINFLKRKLPNNQTDWLEELINILELEVRNRQQKLK